MRKIIFPVLILLLSGHFSYTQEIQFAPAVVPSGGGSSSTHAINLSRWRIGQIHVVTIPSQENVLKQATVQALPDDADSGWTASVYPNPVKSLLKVRFNLKNPDEFAFEISDVAGRRLVYRNLRLIIPGQVEELDLTGLTPAIYFLKVIPSYEGIPELFKITKQ